MNPCFHGNVLPAIKDAANYSILIQSTRKCTESATRGVLPRHNGGLCPPNPPRLAAGSTPRCSLRSHTYGVGGGSYWKVVWGLVKGVTYGGAHTRNKDVPNTDASTKCYRPTWRTNSSVYLHICQVGFDPCFPLHTTTYGQAQNTDSTTSIQRATGPA